MLKEIGRDTSSRPDIAYGRVGRRGVAAMRFFKAIATAQLFSALAACATIPPFVVGGPTNDPAGPKVAALIANLKCEMWQAANSTVELPRYYDDPALPQRRPNPDVTDDRRFNLHNIFGEIAYIGEAEFTLDVTGTSALSPSLNFITPYTAATSLTISANGQASESAHRYLNIYSTIDFERLVETPSYKGTKNIEESLAAAPSPCRSSTELGGRLGLEESLAAPLIAASMNDIAVFPPATQTTPTPPVPAAKVAPLNAGLLPPTAAQYYFGQISVAIDFTIIENVNGGPTYVLGNFKGPSGMTPLLSLNRQVKDTLTITFVPVCIRQKYHITNGTALPAKFEPELVEGTPGWANYLQSCLAYNSAGDIAEKRNALEQARIGNITTRGVNVLTPGL